MLARTVTINGRDYRVLLFRDGTVFSVETVYFIEPRAMSRRGVQHSASRTLWSISHTKPPSKLVRQVSAMAEQHHRESV